MSNPWFCCNDKVLEINNVEKAIKLDKGSLYQADISDNKVYKWTKVIAKDPLVAIKNFWKENVKEKQAIMLGYFSYDFAGYIEPKVLDQRDSIINFPEFYFLTSSQFKFCKRNSSNILEAKPKAANQNSNLIKAHLHNLILDTEYKRLINEAIEYISQGAIYEINLSRPMLFQLKEEIEHPDFAQLLMKNNPAPYSAYLPLEKKRSHTLSICSSSPECFLRKTGQEVSTFPIKGTRPKFNDKTKDKLMTQELLNSKKEQAEHLMVVDLERNDLGRVAIPSSVKVLKYAELNSFNHIHHLISEINCIMKPNLDVFDLIRASFPSGSVTGAPKIRTMQIIRELEPYPRSVYTGSMGFIDSQGDCEFSVLIRTCLLENNKLLLNVGGGIVWDSEPEMENEETYIKARSVLNRLTNW
ncbi:MAG: anthranilate synthase component I family protein [Candidatus Caenarcaniphilales bacterium]|nr:anthranilate synthase component I family protein [Candidatus Caenarcaniphilales bacterium]